MRKLRLFTIFFMAFGLLAGASAETVNMSGTSAGDDGSRPTRGMTAASVESKFGAPASKKAPVGNPPISRWEYPTMTVYFEYDRVIHAVRKR